MKMTVRKITIIVAIIINIKKNKLTYVEHIAITASFVVVSQRKYKDIETSTPPGPVYSRVGKLCMWLMLIKNRSSDLYPCHEIACNGIKPTQRTDLQQFFTNYKTLIFPERDSTAFNIILI